jgi:G protein beta subunit-like protein
MARFWSIQTGEIKKDYIGHQKPVVCLAFADSK